MAYDIEVDRVATPDLTNATTSVAEMESKVDLILASGTSAAGQPAGSSAAHSHWPELLKVVVFPVFMGLAYKALHELLPAHAEALLKRLREQPQNFTASRRLDDVSEFLPSRDDLDFDSFKLASNLLDVMAHLISAITNRHNDSVLTALQPPLKELLNLLSSSSVGFRSGPLLSLAVPQLLKLLELFFSQQAPAGEQVKSYLRLLLADDSKRLAELLLPANLQWLPDFFWGWGALLDEYLAEPEQAHETSPSWLAELGWRIIQTVKRGPLRKLLRERLSELFSPSTVDLIMDPEAAWSDVREQVMALSSALGVARDAVRTLGTFPHDASLGDKLAWGFSFLKSEQASAVIKLLMPARIATPLLATAGITRRLDDLPEGIDFKQAVSSSLVSLKESGDADYVNSLLPGTLDTIVQGIDYWDPLANAISTLGMTAEQSGGVSYLSKVATLSKALLGMAMQALRDFCLRTVAQGKVISTSVTALAIAFCLYYKRKFPTTVDELLDEALRLLPLMLPGATGLATCLLMFRTLVASEVFNIIRVSEQATGPRHNQLLLDHLAERLVALTPISPEIARYGELMLVLPTLIGLFMEPPDSAQENSSLERIAGILVKLNASQDPLISEYVHRIKLLLVSRLTGMSEEEAAPFVPKTRSAAANLSGRVNLRLGLSGLETLAGQVLEGSGESSLQGRLANKLRTLVPLNRFMTLWKFFSVVGIGGADASEVPQSSPGDRDDAYLNDQAGESPTVGESLSLRNTKAVGLIGAGVSTLVLTTFLAWYGYKWATRSQAPKNTEDPEQGSTPLLAPNNPSSPTLHGIATHEYVTVPVEQPSEVSSDHGPSDQVPTSPARKKWAVAIGAAITGVIGASLVGVGVHRLMTRSAIETLVTQPGTGPDPRSLNERLLAAFNEQIASGQTEQERQHTESQPVWTAPELEVAIVQLGLDAGYIPSLEELDESPLLASLWATTKQNHGGDASTVPTLTSASTEMPASSSRRKRHLVIDQTVEDFQEPQATNDNGMEQAGLRLNQTIKENQIPLATVAEIAAAALATEEAVRWMVQERYKEHLAARPRMPDHLTDFAAFAARRGGLIYEHLRTTIPDGTPNTYDATREHEILVHQANPDAMGPVLWFLSSALTLGNNAQSARDRNPYSYESATSADARFTIHDKVKVTEEQLMTGQFQYANGLPADINTDARKSPYVVLPQPKEVIESMLSTDLEARYAEELNPLLPKLRPSLESAMAEQVRHVLKDRVNIVGYDPIAALQSGDASLHQVMLHHEYHENARDTPADAYDQSLRNVVGFIDIHQGLQFALFLDSGYMIDLSNHLPITPEEYERYASSRKYYVPWKVDDYESLTKMMRSQPPSNYRIRSDFIATRIPDSELQKARSAKKPDGSLVYDQTLVESISKVTGFRARGVEIVFGEKQSDTDYAKHQIGFYEKDLIKTMDIATKSRSETNTVWGADTVAYWFSVVAIALGLISIIPTLGATAGLLTAAGSGLAGILSATSAQWPRILISDTPEEAEQAFSKWMISVIIELVAFGVGLKVDVVPRKFGEFVDFMAKKAGQGENMEALLKMRMRPKTHGDLPDAPDIPDELLVEQTSDALARVTVRGRPQLQHSDIEAWITTHPDRFQAILDNSIGAIFAPFIVGGAMTGGSALNEWIHSFRAKLDREEKAASNPIHQHIGDVQAQNGPSSSITPSSSSTPASGSSEELQALLDRLLKDPEFRSALNEQVRLYLAPPPPGVHERLEQPSLNAPLVVHKGERYRLNTNAYVDAMVNRNLLTYRQLPLGVAAPVTDETVALPESVRQIPGARSTYAIRPNDRWIIVDSREVLTYGIYAFGAGQLYKLALSKADRSKHGPRQYGYYRLRHFPGNAAQPFKETLVEAYGQEVPEKTQRKGIGLSDAIQRWDVWETAIAQAGIESSMEPEALRKLQAARQLQLALDKVHMLASISRGQVRIFSTAMLVGYVNKPKSWDPLVPHTERVGQHIQDIRAALEQSHQIKREVSDQPDLKSTLAQYEQDLQTLREHESKILKIHQRMEMLGIQRTVFTELNEWSGKITNLNARLDRYDAADRERDRLERLNNDEYSRLNYYEIDVDNGNRHFLPNQAALEALDRERELIPKPTDPAMIAHAETELEMAWKHFERDMTDVDSSISDVAELLRPVRRPKRVPPPQRETQVVRGLPLHSAQQRKPS